MDGFNHVSNDATADLETQLVKRMEEHGDPSIVTLSDMKGWCSQIATANWYTVCPYANTRPGVTASDRRFGQAQHGGDSKGFQQPSLSSFESTPGWN